MTATRHAVVDKAAHDAVVFDMDGVVTKTAVVHAAAWKRALRRLSWPSGHAATGADSATLRRRGRLPALRRRQAALRRRAQTSSASRDIVLPEAFAGRSLRQAETVCGLGNRKNGYFLKAARTARRPRLRDHRERWCASCTGLGIGTAIISASKNLSDGARRRQASATSSPSRSTGSVAAEIGLAGKPDPAVFLEAARRLGAAPSRDGRRRRRALGRRRPVAEAPSDW